MRCVITGGPGTGKTTVINILATRGYSIAPEAARIVIKEIGIKNIHTINGPHLAEFQSAVAKKQIAIENTLTGNIAFLDRGLIDGYAYCRMGKVEPPACILSEGKNRYEKIFLLDRLPLYVPDEDRYENKSLADSIHEEIACAYKKFGYAPIRVPVLSREERADFIEQRAQEDMT